LHRRLLTSLLTVSICYTIFVNVVFAPLDKLADELEADKSKQGQQAADEEEEGDENSILFIPFPGTTKAVTPKPYKGSDPEWQEYIKISKDTELGKRIRSTRATPPSCKE
jgi:hypothetical protein